jgi:hypothetical protein
VRTPDELRTEAAGTTWHIGPAAACCPTAPCGLVLAERADPGCRLHGYVHTGQAHVDTHAADHCPAVRGGRLEPHHEAARTRTDDEAVALRQRDLLDRMERSNTRRLDALREREGRLL